MSLLRELHCSLQQKLYLKPLYRRTYIVATVIDSDNVKNY